MELGEWTGGWIIENSDNRGSDNRGSTVLTCAHKLLLKLSQDTFYYHNFS